MKKRIILISILVIVIIIGAVGINIITPNDYYVKIIEDGRLQTGEKIGSGDYDYELEAYDKKGNEITVGFQTVKNLRKGAYLKVEVLKDIIRGESFNKNKNAVNILSYEEVQEDKVPKKALEKLNAN